MDDHGGNAASPITVQYATPEAGLPEESRFAAWVGAVLVACDEQGGELGIRLVEEAEGAELNQRYRHQAGSTNVLSFPSEPPPGWREQAPLGDLVICVTVVRREAQEQNKAFAAHLAHMVVHGVLHLLGYDHQRENQATVMESVEIRALAALGYPDPYRNQEPS